MFKYVLIILALVTILALAFVGLRGQTSRQPPVMVFNDLVDQPKYKNQGESPFFADGRQMRLPPPGTVAWGRSSGKPDPSILAEDVANYSLKTMPVPVDAALLQRGQKIFNTYCVVCHGAFGNGNGVATNYGMATPANYHTDRLRQVTDGYLYQVLTEGKGLMGAYGPSIKPNDRWAAVAYVRALQRAGNARIDDVPQNVRPELEKQQ
jgi:mono/diheme cytochrome c family protein